jgi:MinD superfamily P-loop ATPase
LLKEKTVNLIGMPTIIIDTKSKKKEKIIQDFLEKLEVNFYTEVQEEEALYNAMKKGKKSKLLSPNERKSFLNSLKNGK